MAFDNTPSGGYFMPQATLNAGVVTAVAGGATKMEVLATLIAAGHVSRGELPKTATEQAKLAVLCVNLAAAIGAAVTTYEQT